LGSVRSKLNPAIRTVVLGLSLVVLNAQASGAVPEPRPGEQSRSVTFEVRGTLTRRMAEEALTRLIQIEEGELHPRAVLRKSDFPIVLSWPSAEVTVSSPGGLCGGRSIAKFVIKAKGRDEWIERRLCFLVRAKRQVAVAARDLKRGEIVRPEDVRVDSTEVGWFSSRLIRSIEQAVGKRVRRAVRRNRPLTENDLEVPPLIFRGAKAYLYYEGKGFSIRCRGLALVDGWVGDRIPVKSLATGKRLMARVAVKGEKDNGLVVSPE